MCGGGDCTGPTDCGDSADGPATPRTEDWASSAQSSEYHFKDRDAVETESTATQSSATGFPADTPVRYARARAQWQLVWCSERCYKADQLPLRHAIDEIVRELGGGLVSFKKAKTFEAWSRKPFRSPFVLLTDGREFKPCMQSVPCPPNQLLLTLVLVDQQKCSKVRGWVADLVAEGCQTPTQVITDVADIRRHLGRLIGHLSFQPEQARPAEAGAPSPASRPPASAAERKEKALPSGAQAPFVPFSHAVSCAAQKMGFGDPNAAAELPSSTCAGPVVFWAPAQPTLLLPSPPSPLDGPFRCRPPCTSPPLALGGRCSSAEAFKTPFELARSGVLPVPVQTMLQHICPSRSTSELQRVLATAQPASYED